MNIPKRTLLVLLLFAFVASQGAYAQPAENDTGIVTRYTISTGPSVVFDLSGEGDPATSWGADFMYRFNPKWEAGLQLDLNFHKGFKRFEGYSLVPVAAYSVTERFNAFIGTGVEHRRETGDNEFLVRVGGEYSIFLNKEQSAMLLPGAFVDFVDGEFFASVVLAIGYTF